MASEMTSSHLSDVKFSPWREEAACLDAADVSFFPDAEDLMSISRAKAVCAVCPVAAECLTWAVETKQGDGVWGGHTSKERRSIRRRWLEEIKKAS